MKVQNQIHTIFPIFLVLLSSVLFAQENRSSDTSRLFSAHGPRIGFTALYNSETGTWGVPEEASEILPRDIPPVITQFGYHIDTSIFTSSTISPVVQFDLLFGGFETGFLLPSLSMIIGLRSSEFFEFGIGPNLSLSGPGIIYAIGFNYKLDNIYFPINFALVYSQGNYRASLITGFNFPRPSDSF